jgi:UDP-N-acetylmuramate dehydrogenase
VVQNVLTLGFDGSLTTKTREEMSFVYRSSIIQKEPAIVVEAALALQEGDPEQIRREMKECLDRRKQSQPLALPNAGSVFKNPPGHSAGQLIEASGLKGLTIGGAQVSLKHANFIVNLGTATARDVARLIDRIARTVRERFGIELQPEVKSIGEW